MCITNVKTHSPPQSPCSSSLSASRNGVDILDLYVSHLEFYCFKTLWNAEGAIVPKYIKHSSQVIFSNKATLWKEVSCPVKTFTFTLFLPLNLAVVQSLYRRSQNNPLTAHLFSLISAITSTLTFHPVQSLMVILYSLSMEYLGELLTGVLQS